MGKCVTKNSSTKVDGKRAADHLKESLSIQNEVGLKADDLIWSTTYLYLVYNSYSTEYNGKQHPGWFKWWWYDWYTRPNHSHQYDIVQWV